MTSERFLLVTAQGRPVREFESHEAARNWAWMRKQRDGFVPELILIKKTTTVVEEILDYV